MAKEYTVEIESNAQELIDKLNEIKALVEEYNAIELKITTKK